jgi:hypothetical protein
MWINPRRIDPMNQGRQYLRSVKALAAAAEVSEDRAMAILARLARGPDVWLLVTDEELDSLAGE